MRLRVLLSALTSACIAAAQAANIYVDLGCTNSTSPFTSLATAARTIQDGVDAAMAGDTVLVNDGIYREGARIVGTNRLLNRVVVDKPVTLRSLNGPEATVIEGIGPLGTNAVRCVYLTNGASLIGFTLTNGATHNSIWTPTNWYSLQDRNGGGAWCASSNAVASNCVVAGNSAIGEGGGVSGGSWINCILRQNSAGSGGGAYAAILSGCILSKNTASHGGGGTYLGQLTNCTLTANSGHDGGAAFASTLIDCTIARNWATNGGAAGGGQLSGCTISNNFAERGGATYQSELVNCIITGNTGYFGGGVYQGALTNCTLTGNVATYSTIWNNGSSGGAAAYGTLYQCTLRGNLATNAAHYSLNSRGGGAIYSTMIDCIISSNYATHGGGTHSATLTNCSLVGNLAQFGGGAAGGVLTDCTVAGNEANPGGGGGVSDSTLFRCTLTGNWATNFAGDGGGAYGGSLYDSRLDYNVAASDGGGAARSMMSNCTLYANYANGGGGGARGGSLLSCLLISNTARVYGGGFYGAFSDERLTNCVLRGNRAQYGGGAYGGLIFNSTIVSNTASIGPGGVGGGGSLYNSIIYFNAPGNCGSVGVDHCCTVPLPPYATGSFTNEPRLMDLANGDVHLQSTSPCINAGASAYAPSFPDREGNPRVSGGTIDIGAFEFNAPASVVSYLWLQTHGLNTDGSDDFLDSDLDGMINHQEWRAGTNPTQALSVLRLHPLVRFGAGISLKWQSVSGMVYSIERGTNLADPTGFVVIHTNIIGAVGTTTHVDTNPVSIGQNLYRVRVE